MCTPRLQAAARPSLARFTIRWRSSSARALRKAMKPRPMGVEVGFVQHLDHGTASVDALDNVHFIHHRPGGAVPFGDHEHVARTECIDGFL
jgi:hypothetical protein